jgi:hypothetical protein
MHRREGEREREMATPARRRLMRDFKRLQKDPPDGISGAPCDNDILKWNAVIFGSVPQPYPSFLSPFFRLVLSFSLILCPSTPASTPLPPYGWSPLAMCCVAGIGVWLVTGQFWWPSCRAAQPHLFGSFALPCPTLFLFLGSSLYLSRGFSLHSTWI